MTVTPARSRSLPPQDLIHPGVSAIDHDDGMSLSSLVATWPKSDNQSLKGRARELEIGIVAPGKIT
jgi:hypothetical protein